MHETASIDLSKYVIVCVSACTLQFRYLYNLDNTLTLVSHFWFIQVNDSDYCTSLIATHSRFPGCGGHSFTYHQLHY